MIGCDRLRASARTLRRPIVAITVVGAVVRVGYWLLLPPIWKTHAAFNVFELGLIPYVADFAGYKPSRMPFFDVLLAGSYAVFSPLFGTKALTVASVLLGIVAIPVFYVAVSRLFDVRTAIPATLLLALYPKLVTLGARGLPEAAAISFIALALYTFERARATERTGYFLATGLFAMLSYLVFVSAVAFGILLAVFLYLADVRDRLPTLGSIRAVVPTKRFVAFSSIPGFVGVLYLLLGPVSDVLADVSATRESVFVDPAAYSVVEKLFWFVSYSFFDFWWHTRGFDRARGIRPLIRSLQGFMGDLFPVYFLGWASITLSLTALILLGVAVMLRRRRSLDLLGVAWIGTYLGLYVYKNLGWIGGFQTRHVSAVVPALCIAFGVGVVRLLDGLPEEWRSSSSDSFGMLSVGGPVYRRLRAPFSRSVAVGWPTRDAALTAFLVALSLSVLLVNGAAQGAIENRKTTEEVAEPARAVTEIVSNESVGVVWNRDFHTMVLYSENRVRPVVLTDTSEQRETLRDRFGDTAEIRHVRDSLFSTGNVTYLYVRIEHDYVDRFPYTAQMNQSHLERLRSVHEIEYHQRIDDGPFRTTSSDIYLLRIRE